MMAGCILWLRALPLLGGLGARPALRHHTQSAFVQVEQGLLLVVLLFVHSSDLDDLAHDLRLETAAFGFGVDFLDISAERALLVFKPLDALDKRFELRARDTLNIRHDPPLPCCCRPRRRQDDNRDPIANQCCCAAAKAAWLRRGFGRGAIDCKVESLPLRALVERADPM